jgi:integrase
VSRLRRKKETDNILLKIPENYRGFFQIHSRVKSAESLHVAVIDHSKYEDCLAAIKDDLKIREDIKVLLYLIISAGLRISEALSLQRMSFEVDGDNLYFYTKVLKKREFVERRAIVHPVVALAVKSYLLKFRAFDKIFSIDRHQALYAVKSALGKALDLHALRHSHISYLLFEKKLTLEEVEGLIKLNMDTIVLYSHLNSKPLLDDLYSQKPQAKKKAAFSA